MYERYVEFYNRYAHGITTATALLALAAIAIGAGASVTNAQQSAEFRAESSLRDAERDRLLECFNDYAAVQSSGSSAVRVAQVEKDEATTVRDNELNREGRAFLRLVRGILDQTAEETDLDALAESLRHRNKAARRLDRAQDALDRARAENPVPPPPSMFCEK